MAHSDQLKAKVRAAYIQGGVLSTAAALHGVPYATARAWKRKASEAGHDWDIARNARRMTKSGLESMANEVLEGLAEQFTATITALKTDKEMKPSPRGQLLVQLMDGYSKAIAAATRAMPSSNRLAIAMDVIRFLTMRFGERFPKLREAFVQAVEQLGDDLVAEFGTSAGR